MLAGCSVDTADLGKPIVTSPSTVVLAVISIAAPLEAALIVNEIAQLYSIVVSSAKVTLILAPRNPLPFSPANFLASTGS